MKKIITFLVMAICLVALDANAQSPKIMLKHGNNATMFDYNKLADAISASVDGDSIILSEGTFNGDVTINKKISIIGAGQKSIISGSVTFNMSGTQTLTSRLFDGMKITGSVILSSNVKNLSIRKTSMQSLQTNDVQDGLLDRCSITSYLYGENNFYGNIVNSYISTISYAARNLNFINCYIDVINGYSSNFSGKAINSIIKNYYNSSYPYISGYCSLTNCIIGNGIKTTDGVIENCYILSPSEISGLKRDEVDNLVSAGYIGTDGTAVGEYGGQTPFTLTPKGPKITNMELKVDAQNNQLKVTATGTPN